MWGDRALGTPEGGCMYCELGGDVCGEIGHLGHEKEPGCIVIWDYACGEIGRLGHEMEAVCIVSWEGMYVGRSGAWDTRKRLYVL